MRVKNHPGLGSGEDGIRGESGHFYFGENRTSVLWADTRGEGGKTCGFPHVVAGSFEARRSNGGMPDLVLEIRAALATLDLENRVLLLLIDQQGHSYKEAAEILGLSESAVTSRIHRVRRALMEAYEKA